MAGRMAGVLAAHPGAALVAVGSRSADAAGAFAAEHDIPHAFGSYDGLIRGGGIDAVYVATTNQQHHPNTLGCLDAGIAVLCEKPIALDDAQAQEMVDTARRNGVLFVEAMWMRFLPFITRLEEMVSAGDLGRVSYVQADFGFPIPYEESSRWYAPELGGGSLLDMGVYPLTLAFHVLGPPEETKAVAVSAATGVDAQIGVVSRHAAGAVSVLASSFVADTAIEATIAGDLGRLRLASVFSHPPKMTLYRLDRMVGEYDTALEGDGFEHQVEEMHRCLQEGLIESPKMPHADSVAVARWTTEIRRQVGVSFR